MTLRAAVLASGSGTNFAALASVRSLLWEVSLLVVDREGAGAVERARKLGIPVVHVPFTGRSPEEAGAALLEVLESAEIDLVLLAGFLRLVPSPVVARYRGRILNLHPALLPSFGGKGMYGRAVHEAVLASGARVTGVTVHLVDEEYDRGRIFAQWPVPVLPGDTPDTLAERIHVVEHRLYPAAVDALARALRSSEAPRPLPAPPSGATSPTHFHLAPGVPRCAPEPAAESATPDFDPFTPPLEAP